MSDMREEFKKQNRKPTSEDKTEIARLTILKGMAMQAIILIAVVGTFTFGIWNLPSDFPMQLPTDRDYPVARALWIVIRPFQDDFEAAAMLWASWFLFGPFIWYPIFLRGSKKSVSADRQCNSCGALWADYATGGSRETGSEDYTRSRETTDYDSMKGKRTKSIREYWRTHYCDYDYQCDHCGVSTIRKGQWDEKLNEEVLAYGSWEK